MQKHFLCLLATAILWMPLPAQGQAIGKNPVATLNVTQKVTAAAKNAGTAQAKRFVLPNFDLTNAANLATTLGDSPHKKLLNFHTVYTQHNAQALQTLQEILTFASSSQAGKSAPHLIKKLKDFVKDPYLMQIVEQDLSSKQYGTAMRDLAGFYGLDTELIPQTTRLLATNVPEEVFVNTTLDFLEHHPHKVSLPLREILKNPQVSPFKKGINTYIHHSDRLTPQEKENLTSLLHDIHRIHTQSLHEAYQSIEVGVTISFYNQTLTELENFVATHHRQPRWDGPAEEKMLYNRLLVITHENPFNLFTEALEPLHAIRDLMSQYPPILLSWDSTLHRIEMFIQKNGFYPRSYQATNGNTTEEELWLLDHVRHHTAKNPLLYTAIERLKTKYNLPIE